MTVKAGEVFSVPAEASNTAKNIGSGPGAELATHVVEKGRPIVAAADPPL